jgi:hypothetical protein
MFPARLNIGFKNCASFNLINGDGSKFVTLYETESIGFLYDLPYQNLRQTRTQRDADYHRKFQNQERYILNWIGPEISKNISYFSKYIFIARFNLTDKLKPQFNEWFVSKYIRSLLKMDNIIGLRRYMSLEGRHENVIIIELNRPELSDFNILSLEKNKFVTPITGTYKRIIQLP